RHNPKLAFCSVAAFVRAPNCTLLKRLKASARSSKCTASRIGKDFTSEMFSFSPAKLRSLGFNRVILPSAVVGCVPKNETGWKKLLTFGSKLPEYVPRHPSYVGTVGRFAPAKSGKLTVV